MQITLVRHGKYDKSTGRITQEGVEETLLGAIHLLNFITGDIETEEISGHPLKSLYNYAPDGKIPSDKESVLEIPDLILTSPATRAQESSFILYEAFKKTAKGIKYACASCLDDLDKYTNAYKADSQGHNMILPESMKKLQATKPIQDTIKNLQKLEQEGKKHVIIVSHLPNIQVLLNILGQTRSFGGFSPPKNSSLYTLLNVDTQKIGQTKFAVQRRDSYENDHPSINQALYFSFICKYADGDLHENLNVDPVEKMKENIALFLSAKKEIHR